MLVNFFASWCVPCVEEAPTLMALQAAGRADLGHRLQGQAGRHSAVSWTRYGNPYLRVARDEPGRVAIDFGVYGVPETYLVDRAGIVRWRWAGALSDSVVKQSLAPMLKDLA